MCPNYPQDEGLLFSRCVQEYRYPGELFPKEDSPVIPMAQQKLLGHFIKLACCRAPLFVRPTGCPSCPVVT